MSNNELTHYGILGMRWGTSRSSAQSSGGKAKRKAARDMSDEDLTSNVRRMSLEKTYNSLSKQNAKASGVEKAKKVVDAASTVVNQVKNMSSKPDASAKGKLNLSTMTDQQLRERINRTNLEKQYNDMFAPPAMVSRGKQFATGLLDVAGTALAIGGSSLGIALAIKELRG